MDHRSLNNPAIRSSKGTDAETQLVAFFIYPLDESDDKAEVMQQRRILRDVIILVQNICVLAHRIAGESALGIVGAVAVRCF